MRTAKFRDDVLWPIAYRLGMDPGFELLRNQANTLASYINSWVRRLYDSTDWPEWTLMLKFQPRTQPGVAHMVAWDDLPVGPGGQQDVLHIGKVLKVYLLDPSTTWSPVDTPFRLNFIGIHCGFEHGTYVWIKYLNRCPQFTAQAWNDTVTYSKGGLVYSPVTGECYKSITNNNRGHDPSVAGNSQGPLLDMGVEETPGAPDNPGLPATTEIIDIFAAPPSPPLTIPGGDAPAVPEPIPDLPENGSVFEITVQDATGGFLGDASHSATGAESLLDIFTDLQTQLSAEALLSGWTITLVTAPALKIRLEHASEFAIDTATYSDTGGEAYVLPLNVVQAQNYVAAMAPTSGSGQSFKLTLTSEQVAPGALYRLTFRTVDTAEHTAAYTALSTDGPQQVLNGLIANVITLQATDPFFAGVESSLDSLGPSATFVISNTIGPTSLNAQIEVPGSAFWSIVLFPLALVEQVVQGAYSDALGEMGQTDKKQAEQQMVLAEQGVRTGAFKAPERDVLTDQYDTETKGKSRYEI